MKYVCRNYVNCLDLIISLYINKCITLKCKYRYYNCLFKYAEKFQFWINDILFKLKFEFWDKITVKKYNIKTN